VSATPDTATTAAEAAAIRGFALHCPRDRAPLRVEDPTTLHCPDCGTRFPVVGGVPVLINDGASVFTIADYAAPDTGYEGAAYGREADRSSGPRRAWRRLARWLADAPTGLRHPSPEDALAMVARERGGELPRVLVVGSGGIGLRTAAGRILYTDVAFGPGVDAIADAHDLPFADDAFDLVVATAVLEHVADPQRCVEEFRRVLAPGGLVYAVTPFLQPVHMGAYDFTRFTPIGHRRLFRHFDEIDAGVAVGVGSVAAWTFGATLMAASENRVWQAAARSLGLLVTAPLRFLDRVLKHGAGAAGGCWFIGRLRDGAPVSDRELVQTYRLPPLKP
jgi:SAM-dependent methyltransferase/uncharacterized protein YbaR (Trm112 family)